MRVRLSGRLKSFSMAASCSVTQPSVRSQRWSFPLSFASCIRPDIGANCGWFACGAHSSTYECPFVHGTFGESCVQMLVKARARAFCVKATGATRVAMPAPASCHEKMSWTVFGCVVPNARSRVCMPVSISKRGSVFTQRRNLHLNQPAYLSITTKANPDAHRTPHQTETYRSRSQQWSALEYKQCRTADHQRRAVLPDPHSNCASQPVAASLHDVCT